MAEQTKIGWWKWITVVVVIVLAGSWWHFRKAKNETINYRTELADRGELVQTVTATGTLNPVVNVTVGSQVSGRISKLYVDFNSPVKQGEILAEIDPSTYQATVEQVTADLANAKANLELQQVQFKRTSELFTNNLVSGSDYDIALAALHQAEATLKIKQASLNNALVNLNYCKIVSPVDGVVISRAVELGQTVASSFNTPTIFQIANDLTRMQIDAAVAEADVGGVLEGQAVDFTVDAYPMRTFHGEVTQVRNSPTTVNNVVTYDAVIGVTNSDYKLKPGMTANVAIIVAQRENVLKLPNAALRFQPPANAVVLTNEMASAANTNAVGGKLRGKANRSVRTVYVLAGNEGLPALKPVQVKTGITDGIYTEILDGLAEGDKVVTGIQSGGNQDSGSSNPFGGGFPRRH